MLVLDNHLLSETTILMIFCALIEVIVRAERSSISSYLMDN